MEHYCECGCGQVVNLSRSNCPNRFIVGHAVKGKKFSKEHREKISKALHDYAISPKSHLHMFHKQGKEHPNWRGGINAKCYQRIAFEVYGKQCQRCSSVRYLLVHHKDKNRYNSDIGNLEVLCKSCHNREHGTGMHFHTEETKAKLRALAKARFANMKQESVNVRIGE